MGLYAAAAFPTEAKDVVINENRVEPGTNENTLQAWTDSTDGGDGKGFHVEGSTTITYAPPILEMLVREGSTSSNRFKNWRLGYVLLRS